MLHYNLITRALWLQKSFIRFTCYLLTTNINLQRQLALFNIPTCGLHYSNSYSYNCKLARISSRVWAFSYLRNVGNRCVVNNSQLWVNILHCQLNLDRWEKSEFIISWLTSCVRYLWWLLYENFFIRGCKCFCDHFIHC